MVRLLTPEWLDLQREMAAELPEKPGATACIGYTVTGGESGDVVFHLALEDGRLVAAAPGAADDADFSMRLSHEDFVASVRGELDPAVGFMQGRVKVTGDIGRMLSVLPVTQSEAWRAAMASLAEQTEF